MRCAVLLLGLLLVGGGVAEEECQAADGDAQQLTSSPFLLQNAVAGGKLPQGHLLQEDDEAHTDEDLDEDVEFEDGEEDQDDEADAEGSEQRPKFRFQRVSLPRGKTCSGSSSVIDTSGRGRACKQKCKASAACKAFAFSKRAKECRAFSTCDTFADATGRWWAFKKVPRGTRAPRPAPAPRPPAPAPRPRPPAPAPAPAPKPPAPAPKPRPPAPAPAPAPKPMGGSVTAEAVKAWKLLNQLRKAGTTCGSQKMASTSGVVFDCRLWKASLLHAEDMREHNYFSHTSQDGRSPWTRAKEQGITANGENIAKGQRTPEGVTGSWEKSQGHCKNMMNPSRTMVGIAYAKPYWVEMLGSSKVEADTSCLPTSLVEADLEDDEVADYMAEVLSAPGDVDVPADSAEED